jgi:hypothetical protein
MFMEEHRSGQVYHVSRQESWLKKCQAITTLSALQSLSIYNWFTPSVNLFFFFLHTKKKGTFFDTFEVSFFVRSNILLHQKKKVRFFCGMGEKHCYQSQKEETMKFG